MPEQLTKYPDVTMQVLESGGAQCAAGAQPQILTTCPGDQLCTLPGGEVCIYGVEQVTEMTQIEPKDLAPAVCPEASALYLDAGMVSAEAFVLSATFFAGLAIGAVLKRRGKD